MTLRKVEDNLWPKGYYSPVAIIDLDPGHLSNLINFVFKEGIDDLGKHSYIFFQIDNEYFYLISHDARPEVGTDIFISENFRGSLSLYIKNICKELKLAEEHVVWTMSQENWDELTRKSRNLL